jgi:hypothetical protein
MVYFFVTKVILHAGRLLFCPISQSTISILGDFFLKYGPCLNFFS